MGDQYNKKFGLWINPENGKPTFRSGSKTYSIEELRELHNIEVLEYPPYFSTPQDEVNYAFLISGTMDTKVNVEKLLKTLEDSLKLQLEQHLFEFNTETSSQ